MQLEISQISGASKTSVSGYVEEEKGDSRQFEVNDDKTLDEVVKWLMDMDFVPSFCTACYREGRTGDRFMSLVKSGQIANCCHPNALLTLEEYLQDYAEENTRDMGENMIISQLDLIPNEKIRELVRNNLDSIKKGKRDFRI